MVSPTTPNAAPPPPVAAAVPTARVRRPGPYRVGIADTSSFLRAVIQDTLVSVGLEVWAFQSAGEILQNALAADLDLLVCDTHLADQPGAETVMMLKANGMTAHIPVVLTSQDVAALPAAAQGCGATLYLEKPFSPGDLVNWLREKSQILFGERLALEKLDPAAIAAAASAVGLPAEGAGAPAGPSLPPDVLERLIGELKAEDMGTRMEACYQLGEAKATEAVDALIEGLFDLEDDVRSEAAHALGMIGDSRAIQDLLPLLSYKNELVRERAAEALGNIGDPAALTPLMGVLKSGQRDMIVLATKALAKIGDPAAIPAIEELVTSRDPEVQANATWALREMTGAN